MAREFGIAQQVLVCRDSTFRNIPSQYKPYEFELLPLIHTLRQTYYITFKLAFGSKRLKMINKKQICI